MSHRDADLPFCTGELLGIDHQFVIFISRNHFPLYAKVIAQSLPFGFDNFFLNENKVSTFVYGMTRRQHKQSLNNYKMPLSFCKNHQFSLHFHSLLESTHKIFFQ